MKKITKSTLRIIGFMIILLAVLNTVNKVLKVKYFDGIYSLTKFYELEDNTVDVLFLGSSHAFEDINTGKLWDEYGIASYVLGGSIQPLWNTYYYLKEALKTQTPKLIVLEGYMVTYSEDYIDDSRIINNNYGLKWSKDKIESIKVSSPKERWKDFLFEYTQYHNRYTELSSEDFLPNKGERLYDDWKGFFCNMDTTELENPIVTDVVSKAEIYGKVELYYRNIIETCQKNSIPIMVIINPYAGISETQQQIYNSAAEIAKDYGIDFINYNLCLQEIGIDFATDASDSEHLNYRGNQKISEVVGRYITENYDIPDRRGNLEYQSWDNNAHYIKEIIQNQELIEACDIKSFISQIPNKNHIYFISIDGNFDFGNEQVSSILNAFQIAPTNREGIWYVGADGEIWYSGEKEAECYIELSGHDVCMRRVLNEDIAAYLNTLVIDNSEYKKVINGINVTIYSSITQTIVDSVGFNAVDAFKLVR